MLIFDKYTQFPQIRGDYKAFSFQYVKELFISAPLRARGSIRVILGGTEQTARLPGGGSP